MARSPGLADPEMTCLISGCFPSLAHKIPILNIQVKIFPALCTVAGTIFSCTNYFGVIFTGGVGKNGSTIAGTSVLSPFLHIGSVIALAAMIYKKSAVQLFERHPCLYILTFGFVSAKITNKLVVAHMTKSEMHLHDTAFIGPALLFLDQYFNSFIDEYIVLWIALCRSGISKSFLRSTQCSKFGVW
ncbi:choline ethanolaminephosphotransferase 1 [Limosa lapponica baueri]|uniref:Choline ethanolaminephosphotransferase 1 n=1 Tax=Limosa lapponica baueri TaxID=1758121 RepID=A0A2I0T4A3_LIMLA|nr:choline ethanolaminephosphotransferase 1 [Limosa lapponica baueri]